jgi:plastocyanin
VGAISGRVTFSGAPPAAVAIKMDSDPACVSGTSPNPQTDAVLVGNDGALANVFVYVKDGLDPDYAFAPPATSAILDQDGCHYKPRVLGVRVGQTIEISNSDPTFHNVHALPITNPEFNRGLPTEGSKMTRTFTEPEVMVRFKCDVHGWMMAHVGVLPHPYFAVTGVDGSFSLAGVPPGTYMIEAWHERFGTRSMQVTVATSGTATSNFTFAAQ